ncbi:uncharacterized protein VNE69_03022 [Vairimorpha necatrix]|uniref:Uncharacterized protein n=1 Tax=Vairimorpha necatrix TaxID=6039 RepID=A0AAX4JA61_9MICR
MLKGGQYTVVDLLCISNSLLEQLNSTEDHKSSPSHVYKSVLESSSGKKVVYFLGNIEIGQNTIINVTKDKECPLLYKEDYQIIQRTNFITNKILLEKLINKNNV